MERKDVERAARRWANRWYRNASSRGRFRGQSLDAPCDMLGVAYFASYARWSYLTIPFLYTCPGLVSEEIAPWEEYGEQWRALRVTFPDTIVSHTRNQVSHFGPDGLLRRQEYTVDVLGNAQGLNYASDYRVTNGLAVPQAPRICLGQRERKVGGLCSSRSISMRSNSPNLADSIILPRRQRRPATSGDQGYSGFV